KMPTSQGRRAIYQTQGVWRLLGAQKALQRAIEDAGKLLDQTARERLKRQIQRLDARHAALRRDVALLRDRVVPDIAEQQRLATQIVELFQDVGRLEQQLDAMAR